jgi:hypothetical protein
MNERDKELAEQAGVGDTWNKADWYSISPEMLKKFAALIRADEREFILNLVQKIAVRFYKDDAEEAFEELTEAIRARGNT